MEDRGVPYSMCGKLIVGDPENAATGEGMDSGKRLKDVKEIGTRNGVPLEVVRGKNNYTLHTRDALNT
jgi:hypothetical protein